MKSDLAEAGFLVQKNVPRGSDWTQVPWSQKLCFTYIERSDFAYTQNVVLDILSNG